MRQVTQSLVRNASKRACLIAVRVRAQIAHPSFFVGLLLRGAVLPYSNYGHVVLAQPSPILFYPISSTEVRRTGLRKQLASFDVGEPANASSHGVQPGFHVLCAHQDARHLRWACCLTPTLAQLLVLCMPRAANDEAVCSQQDTHASALPLNVLNDKTFNFWVRAGLQATLFAPRPAVRVWPLDSSGGRVLEFRVC